MGQSAAATVREIEDIRDRLDAEMRELERRVPQPAVWAKRLAGIAVGGGLGAIVLTSLARRARAKRRSARRAGPSQPVQAVVQVVPEDVAERVAARVSGALEDGRWKRWAAAGAGVWLTVRLLELRQLRRLNRGLVGGRLQGPVPPRGRGVASPGCHSGPRPSPSSWWRRAWDARRKSRVRGRCPAPLPPMTWSGPGLGR